MMMIITIVIILGQIVAFLMSLILLYFHDGTVVLLLSLDKVDLWDFALQS